MYTRYQCLTCDMIFLNESDFLSHLNQDEHLHLQREQKRQRAKELMKEAMELSGITLKSICPLYALREIQEVEEGKSAKLTFMHNSGDSNVCLLKNI